MGDGRNFTGRMRTISLFASTVALLAFAVTMLADNHNAGFGHSVTRGQQIFLLVLAGLLCAVRTSAYFIERRSPDREPHREAKWVASRSRNTTE